MRASSPQGTSAKLVVVTDDKDTLGRPLDWTDDDKNDPAVKVIVVPIGADVDLAALQAVTTASGGSLVTASSPNQTGQPADASPDVGVWSLPRPIPVLPLDQQRVYGQAFRDLAEFQTRIREVAVTGEALAREINDALLLESLTTGLEC